MKVLLTSTPGTGHILPMVPLGRALRDAGHEVVWATAPSSVAAVGGFGFEARSAGLEPRPIRAQFVERAPQFRSLPPRDRRALAFATLFCDIRAPAMYDDLFAVFDEVRPVASYREAAERLASDFAAMPTPAEVVPLLEELV